MHYGCSTSHGKLLVAAMTALACVACDDAGELAEKSELAQVAPSPDAPPAPRILRVKADGSGCPPGSYDAIVRADGTSADISFSAYFLERTSSLQIKNCSIILDYEAPPGFSVAVGKLALLGYAHQSPTVTIDIASNQTFVGGLGWGPGTKITDNSLPEFAHSRVGPADGAFAIEDVVEEGRLVFSDCQRPSSAVVNTRLVLRDTARGSGYLSLLSVAGIRLITRPCPNRSEDGAKSDAGGAGLVDADAGTESRDGSR